MIGKRSNSDIRYASVTPITMNTRKWKAVYAATLTGLSEASVSAPALPCSSTLPSTLGVYSGLPAATSSTRNQTATASAPIMPVNSPSSRMSMVAGARETDE